MRTPRQVKALVKLPKPSTISINLHLRIAKSNSIDTRMSNSVRNKHFKIKKINDDLKNVEKVPH